MTTVTVDRGGRSERESRPARPEVPAGSRLEGCPMGSSCRTRACAALTGQVASLLRTRTGSIAAHVIDAEARRTLRRGCTRAALGNRPVGRRLRCGGGVVGVCVTVAVLVAVAMLVPVCVTVGVAAGLRLSP